MYVFQKKCNFFINKVKKERFFRNILLTLLVQGERSYMTPPPSVFYSHTSCVRAIVRKFYDFLNNVKAYLVKLFFC